MTAGASADHIAWRQRVGSGHRRHGADRCGSIDVRRAAVRTGDRTSRRSLCGQSQGAGGTPDDGIGREGGSTRRPYGFPVLLAARRSLHYRWIGSRWTVGRGKGVIEHLAENDFFGGFGPTADAPGVAIWSLAEVSMQLKQPEFDRWLWPHISRKTNFVMQMLSPDRSTVVPVSGPIVPSRKRDPELSLVSEPNWNGLIVGNKDTQRSFMHVNAVNYRGLLSAAELAERINRPEEALRYRAVATR